MTTREQKILKLLQMKKQIKTQDVVSLLKVSRQYAKVLINNLITERRLMKIGSTRSSFYVSLDSFGTQLIINNQIPDLFVANNKKSRRGTSVSFEINIDSAKHLNDIFKQFTDAGENGDYGFDKTEVKVKLYTMGGVHVSRSQARRVLNNLDKFKSIIFDFDKVPMVGQAFADEIFRVFHNKYPDIKLEAVNMNEAVKFMVDRVEGHNPRKTPNLFGE